MTPTLELERLTSLIGALRTAGTRLSSRSTDSILSSLEKVVDLWTRQGSRWRREAETALPAATGFSAEMVRYALPLMLEPLQSGALPRLLDVELGDRRVLDGFVGGRTAKGPSLVLHILSGNVAGLAALPVSLSLAIKSPILVKAAQGDRVFPELFARSIAEVDPDLGASVVARYWRGGDRTLEDRVFAEVDLVVASGSDASVAAARARSPARFIGHGHRVSFAVVMREVLDSSDTAARAAAGLAEDVALWDQRGCLSPQICFVEGGFDAASQFACRLAPEFEKLDQRLPPGRMNFEEQSAVRRFRDEAEWRALGGAQAAVFAPTASLGWTIVVDGEPAFRPTPLCRSLRVLSLTHLDDLRHVLRPARPVLEAAGVAGAPARCAEIEDLLAGAGVHWVAPIGRMQRAPLAWPQGGRPRIADWVTWHGTDAQKH